MKSLLTLLLISVSGASAFVYSCNEVKELIHNKTRIDAANACVSLDEFIPLRSGLATEVFVQDGKGKERWSLVEVVEAGGCVNSSVSAIWSIVTTRSDEGQTIDCTSQFTVMFGSIDTKIITARGEGHAHDLFTAGNVTIVDPRGGILIDFDCTNKEQEIFFYSGMGNDLHEETFFMGKSRCEDRFTLWALDTAITLGIPEDGYIHMTVYGTGGYLSIGATAYDMVLMGSGRSNNLVQHGEDDKFIWLDSDFGVTFHIDGYAELDESVGNNIVFTALCQKNPCTSKTVHLNGTNVHLAIDADLLSIDYYTKVNDSTYWRDDDSFFFKIVSTPLNSTDAPPTVSTSTTASPVIPAKANTDYSCGCELTNGKAEFASDLWMDIIFVVDVSQAMDNSSLEKASAMVESIVNSLRLDVNDGNSSSFPSNFPFFSPFWNNTDFNATSLNWELLNSRWNYTDSNSTDFLALLSWNLLNSRWNFTDSNSTQFIESFDWEYLTSRWNNTDSNSTAFLVNLSWNLINAGWNYTDSNSINYDWMFNSKWNFTDYNSTRFMADFDWDMLNSRWNYTDSNSTEFLALLSWNLLASRCNFTDSNNTQFMASFDWDEMGPKWNFTDSNSTQFLLNLSWNLLASRWNFTDSNSTQFMTEFEWEVPFPNWNFTDSNSTDFNSTRGFYEIFGSDFSSFNNNKYSRVGLVAASDKSQIIFDLSTPFNSSVNLQQTNAYQADIGSGISTAMDMFSRASNRSSRQLIFVISASDSSSSSFKINFSQSKLLQNSPADSFKNGGGIIAVTEVDSFGSHSSLRNLASPGYYSYGFNNDTNVDLQTLCDANCFCAGSQTAFSDNDRQTPNRGCYTSPPFTSSYQSAKSFCASSDSLLSTIHDHDKQYLVIQMVSQYGAKKAAWIGYEKNGNDYEWIDTSNSTFTAWASGEPNTAKGNCVYSVQTTGFNSAWYAEDCNANHLFVCEKAPCSVSNYCD